MPDEVVRLEGIPVTTPARTLIDIAAVVGFRELERSLAGAPRRDLVRSGELNRLLSRHRGRRGTRRLKGLLSREEPPAFTRSQAEERLLWMIRDAGLPDPGMNVTVDGFEVDCFWRRHRLAVEVDGYAHHSSGASFVRDRQRDAALAAEGIQVLRLTWQQIERQRVRTLVQLAQVLARASGR